MMSFWFCFCPFFLVQLTRMAKLIMLVTQIFCYFCFWFWIIAERLRIYATSALAFLVIIVAIVVVVIIILLLSKVCDISLRELQIALAFIWFQHIIRSNLSFLMFANTENLKMRIEKFLSDVFWLVKKHKYGIILL